MVLMKVFLKMLQSYISVLLLLSVLCIDKIFACKGCVGLDEYSFNKIVPRFRYALVKFDTAFPYGPKHEAFVAFAEEAIEINDLLLVLIGVKDYGEKDNIDFAKKFDVAKEDFPVIKLFKQGLNEPFNYTTSEFNTENLRAFVRDNTNLYFGLPGCLERYDKLAKEFMESTDKKTILKKAEELSIDLNEKEKNRAKTYTVFMKKIAESGDRFIKQENERLEKLKKEKMSENKKNDLQIKLNILRTFSIFQKDEL